MTTPNPENLDVQKYSLMEKISTEILSKMAMDPVENIQTVLDGLSKIFGSNFSFYVQFGDKNSNTFRFNKSIDEKIKDLLLSGKGMCGELIQKRNESVLIIPDFTTSKIIQPSAPLYKAGLRSYIGANVMIGQDGIGILALADTKPRNFSKTDVSLMESLSRFVALEESRRGALKDKQMITTKYKTFFDNLSAGAVLLNGNIIVDANQEFCRMLGYTKEEFLGNRLDMFSPKYQADGNLSANKAKLYLGASRKKPQRFEWTHQQKNGRLIYTEVSLTHMYLIDNADTLAFIYDISRQRKHEKELIDARKEAENADRMKSVFLSNMSHEIRTPLNSILGFSDLLLDEETTREEGQIYSEMIRNAGRSLLQLIEDIIDISKIEAGQLSIKEGDFDVNKVLQQILLNTEQEKIRREKDALDIKLTQTYASTPLMVYSDEFRFRQIFTNLLTNALKFTDEGSIEFGYRSISPHKILFFVKDTGSGIDPNDISLIFERFGQSNLDYTKNKEGKGLGLAITHSLVRLLGGDIWVDSEVGLGSTFYFTVPIEPSISIQLGLKNVFDSVLEGKTILVADNVEENFHFIRGALQSTRALFIWAKGGIEAVKACSENPDIDLVLMDIMMPDLDGISATKLIKKMNNKVPVIAQTAFSSQHEKIITLNNGFDDYLVKPIDFKELYQILTKYLLT